MQGNKGISRPGSPRRRSFSQKALEVESSGPLGEVLAGALTKSGESGYRLTHSFHPYPGRFHPGLPELILQRVARPGQWILDPFMGGGSTLVEALLQGLGAMGNDLNPVARLVARERTRCREPAEAAALQGEAARIAGLVEALRNDRHPPRFTRRELGPLRKHYQPHLLAELTQWIRLIEDVKAFKVRETLRAVFSSAVVKFSNRASDSSQEEQQTSYPKGAVTRFLTAKTGELAQAQRELARRLPAGTPAVRFYQEDSRLLPSLHWGVVDHVITSPPYPGTYDYFEQHRLRMEWLGLDQEPFLKGEMGARREGVGDSWSESLRETMLALARVVRPDGNVFIVLGDWLRDDHAVDGSAQLVRVAREKGWRLESRASVRREIFSKVESKAYARRGKWEHLLHLRRATAPAMSAVEEPPDPDGGGTPDAGNQKAPPPRRGKR